MRKFHYVIYKITFPNGKIYVGKDVGAGGHSMRYFGSWSNEAVERDFTKEELSNFTLSKRILFESEDRALVSMMEGRLIIENRSYLPEIGYNQKK